MTAVKQKFNSILVIDDNEAIHQDFSKIFDSLSSNHDLDELAQDLFGEEDSSSSLSVSFDLQFASQGKEGVDVLRQAMDGGNKFGLAFVDMRMPPGWDGVETIEQLWKVDEDLQVVICTAYSDRSWDDILEKLGTTDKLLILKKPFDSIEVIQIATSLCEKRRLMELSLEREKDLKSVVETQQTELIEAHKDAEILIDSMSNILVSLDQDGVVSRWNRVATDIFGIAIEDALGKPFKALPIRWENWEEVSQALRDCGTNEKQELQVGLVDTQGGLRILNVTIGTILCDLTNRARLFLATDVTQQKMLQSQLDQALRLESVGQLAAGVAHEINTPMQYIGDNVRFVSKSLSKMQAILDVVPSLVDQEVSDLQLGERRGELFESFKASKIESSLRKIPEALQDSIEGVESVAKIVAAMKEFSHPGNDEKSQVDINHILESTITVAKNEWKYVADVETEFEAGACNVDGLSSELNQAFLNIIVNASHAIAGRVDTGDLERGKIRISTRSEGGNVVVSIEDNGGGIPASVREKVFEPFFTTKEVGKGTGQGLAIAYSVVVQKHQGQLSFEVADGEGTTFIVKLPNKDSCSESKPVQQLIGAQA